MTDRLTLIAELTPAHQKQLTHIVNSSVDDGLLAIRDIPRDAEHRPLILAALANEEQTTNRSTLVSKLKVALKQCPVPEAEITALADAKTGLEAARDRIIEHEEAFQKATLQDRLNMGLHCLKAHNHFAVTDPGKRNKSGKNQHSKGGLVTRDEASFEGWLRTECPWLKKPTAYKYMTALRGLGLDHKATEEQVAMGLDQLRAVAIDHQSTAPTLKSLCDAAVEVITDQTNDSSGSDHPNHEQQEFQFLKDSLSHFREQAQSLVGIKDELQKHPDFLRAASCRVYQLLSEITGTHWKPSDEPSELADIDPDTISI